MGATVIARGAIAMGRSCGQSDRASPAVPIDILWRRTKVGRGYVPDATDPEASGA